MRTTVDLPDHLYRRAKATAALRGLKLRELLSRCIEQELAGSSLNEEKGHRRPIPVIIPSTGRKIPVLTNAELFEALDRDI